MAILSYNELKEGTLFVRDGQPHKVLSYSFVRMQQRKPVAQLKIKNLITGKVIDYTAHQTDSFEEAEIEPISAVFIYEHRGEYWFHYADNPGKRFSLSGDTLGNTSNYLKPKGTVTVMKFNDEIISVQLPIKMEFKVTEAPPAVKGDTAQGGSKTAIIETGGKVIVPLFIQEGDAICINTETGDYVERTSKG